MKSFCGAIALGLVVFTGMPAWANSECPPLSIVSSTEITIGADGRAYVPAEIGGKSKSMLVDTGGFFTEMNQTTADELKLTARHTNLILVGVAGDTTRLAVRTSFKLGNLTADGMDFMVMAGNHELAPDVADAAGILAPNLLRTYDLDLDFGGHKMNLISQKHCDGKVIYWPASSVAVVPMRVNPTGHITIPVELDGQHFNAQLDTGASTSVINLDTAKNAFGLSIGSADVPVEGTVGYTRTYAHRFKSLSLEGIAISNPRLELISDLMRGQLYDPHANIEGDTRIANPDRETGLGDMILGMDILHHLHVYIAYKEQKLYITPASAPTTAAVPPPATPPASAQAVPDK
jgi:predicted aspartyl protease